MDPKQTEPRTTPNPLDLEPMDAMDAMDALSPRSRSKALYASYIPAAEKAVANLPPVSEEYIVTRQVLYALRQYLRDECVNLVGTTWYNTVGDIIAIGIAQCYEEKVSSDEIVERIRSQIRTCTAEKEELEMLEEEKGKGKGKEKPSEPELQTASSQARDPAAGPDGNVPVTDCVRRQKMKGMLLHYAQQHPDEVDGLEVE